MGVEKKSRVFDYLNFLIYHCSREEAKKRRSLVQVFEDQGMEISHLIYGNYKYVTLVWKVWTMISAQKVLF